jgi:hypothetical protein
MIRLTKHAQEAISIRRIRLDWIEVAITKPDFVEVDPVHSSGRDPTRQSPILMIAFSKVVYWPDGAETVGITAHFDRKGMP